MAGDIRRYLRQGAALGLDADDLRQEAELGRIEGGEPGAIRRVRRMISAARRDPGQREADAVIDRDNYHIDPRNECVAAVIARMPPLWREVLTIRHGLDGRGERPWSVTARAVGVRLEKAREIEAAARAFIARSLAVQAMHKSGLK